MRETGCGCPVDTSAEQKHRPSRQARPRTFEARMGLVNKKRTYPLGYVLLINKSARRDSNPRPPPWQGGAPPTEPLAQCTKNIHCSCEQSLFYRNNRLVSRIILILLSIFLYNANIYLYLEMGVMQWRGFHFKMNM